MSYGYDNAGRINSIAHTVVSTGATLISYTATYYDNGWLHTITEQPSGDVTTFSYDAVGNLLNEVRTGAKPYSGTYTYYADNQRETAVVVTNGVTTHNGAYTYNGAGWLSQCVDSATGLTEIYTWNNDGTLASAPRRGYTKLFFYNEEQQLITIQHNTSGTITTVYQYGYASDGGRRWRKDIANNVWTWYPCGAAVSAEASAANAPSVPIVTGTRKDGRAGEPEASPLPVRNRLVSKPVQGSGRTGLAFAVLRLVAIADATALQVVGR